MTKKQPTILVCAYFANNLGDDLFLKILIERYPNVKWELLTANRNYKKLFKDLKNVNIIYSYRDLPIGKKQVNPFFYLTINLPITKNMMLS